MQRTRGTALLKFEGFLISALMIAFMIIFYFKLVDKYMLTMLLLGLSACIFSINSSLEQSKDNAPMAKLNFIIALLFSVATIILGVYFYSKGLLTFKF